MEKKKKDIELEVEIVEWRAMIFQSRLRTEGVSAVMLGRNPSVWN